VSALNQAVVRLRARQNLSGEGSPVRPRAPREHGSARRVLPST